MKDSWHFYLVFYHLPSTYESSLSYQRRKIPVPQDWFRGSFWNCTSSPLFSLPLLNTFLIKWCTQHLRTSKSILCDIYWSAPPNFRSHPCCWCVRAGQWANPTGDMPRHSPMPVMGDFQKPEKAKFQFPLYGIGGTLGLLEWVPSFAQAH